MRKRWIVIIIALIFIGIYTIRVFIREGEITSALKHYLFVEQRYNATEIKDIKVSYHLDRLILGYDPFVSSVIFSDEPDTIYFYSFKGNKIYPVAMGGTSPGNKH